MTRKHGTFIHGIAASQHIDSSGERIIISGVDVSSLTLDGVFNFEHESKQASQIVGKILEAKKILTKDDCENKHHKFFWDKVKMPFIYVMGELFDSVNHIGANDVAAMARYDKNVDDTKTKKLINFSIEGSRLGKEGSNITNCIARKVTVTLTPCNKMAQAEQLDNPSKEVKEKSTFDIKEILGKFKKSEEIEVEFFKSEDVHNYQTNSKTRNINRKKNVNQKKIIDRKKNVNQKKRVNQRSSKDFFTSNVRKAITASCGLGAPSSMVGGAALQKEHILKYLAEDSWQRFEKKDDIIRIIQEKSPSMSKTEVEAVAKTFSYMQEKKKEMSLEKALVDRGMSRQKKVQARAERADNFKPKTKEKFTADGLRTMPKPKAPAGSEPKLSTDHGNRPKRGRLGLIQGGKKDSSDQTETDIMPNLAASEDDRCWDGYKPAKGKKAYSKGSCVKKSKKILKKKSEDEDTEKGVC